MLARRLGRALALAVAMAAGLGSAAGFAQPVPTIQATVSRKAKKGLFNGRVKPGSWWRHTYLNHGSNAAQVQRAARKARNVKRHRRHVRG